MSLGLALLLAAAASAPAEPHDASAVCVRETPPPPGLAAWSSAAPGMEVRPGTAVRLTLTDVASLRWTLPPDRAPVGGTYGAVLPVHVATAGTYRIALSARAWIDVVQAGRRVESSAHTPGEACSGIRKIVDFRLQPGDYSIQLSDAAGPDATLLFAPAR